MPVAVHGDLVAGRGDLARERRVRAHLLADEEERRRRAGAASVSSTAGVPSGVRAVVEGQRDASSRSSVHGRSRRRARPARTTGAAAGRSQSSPHAASASTSEAADGQRREREPGRRPRSPARRRSAAASSALRRRDLGEPERRNAALLRADVAAAPAVRDRRAAAHVRLEHGQPAGRVDERVGRGRATRSSAR